MNQEQAHAQMVKLYGTYTGRGATVGERDNARSLLGKLAKKHRINLREFLDQMEFDSEFASRANASAEAAKKRREDAEAKEYKATAKRPSRRSLIISMLKDNIFDVDSINEVLDEVFGYSDRKANKKAISGTRYDFRVNKGWFFKDCDCGRVVTEAC